MTLLQAAPKTISALGTMGLINAGEKIQCQYEPLAMSSGAADQHVEVRDWAAWELCCLPEPQTLVYELRWKKVMIGVQLSCGFWRCSSVGGLCCISEQPCATNSRPIKGGECSAWSLKGMFISRCKPASAMKQGREVSTFFWYMYCECLARLSVWTTLACRYQLKHRQNCQSSLPVGTPASIPAIVFHTYSSS